MYHTCYYFDNIVKFEDFILIIFLIDKKSNKNILICNISYKTLINPKRLSIRFNKMDGFIKTCDGTRYLRFFCSEKYDAIYNRIRYFIGAEKWHHVYFSHYFAKVVVDSYDSLPIGRILTLHNVITHIKSVLNKDDKNQFYCKCSYQLATK